MTSLDDELRRTLARRPAPAGFDARVLARVRRPVAARRWLAAAAAVFLVALGSARYVTEQRAAATQAARVQAELRLALTIASESLARVQRRLETAGDR